MRYGLASVLLVSFSIPICFVSGFILNVFLIQILLFIQVLFLSFPFFSFPLLENERDWVSFDNTLYHAVSIFCPKFVKATPNFEKLPMSKWWYQRVHQHISKNLSFLLLFLSSLFILPFLCPISLFSLLLRENFVGSRKSTSSFRGTQKQRANRTIDKLEVNDTFRIRWKSGKNANERRNNESDIRNCFDNKLLFSQWEEIRNFNKSLKVHMVLFCRE